MKMQMHNELSRIKAIKERYYVGSSPTTGTKQTALCRRFFHINYADFTGKINRKGMDMDA